MFYRTQHFASALALCSTLGAVVSEAKIFQTPRDVHDATYDFIIVGGGTAGSVLANRLTEDPNTKVLVIEAGGSNEGVLASIVPFLGVSLPNTEVDWNFTATPQESMFNRTFHYARGHVLGGSSSINLLTWNRGSNDVWDNWANITEDQGWSWPSVEKYYLKTSRLVAPADHHNTSGQVIPAAHGNGPVQVSLAGFPSELDDRVINTSRQVGGKFRFNEDINAGDSVGFSYLQASIATDTRSSAATAYLKPVEKRSNLDIVLHTQATRLIQTGYRKDTPEFKAVEISNGPTSPCFLVHAKYEVILATGVVGTPQLLQLSGIGPKKALNALGIHSIVDLPDVGQRLADHPMLPNYFSVNSNGTFDIVLRDQSVFGALLEQWNTSGTGLFVNSPSNTLGFLRLPPDSAILKNRTDPSSGPLSAHTEILFVDGYAQFGDIPQPPTGNFLTLLTAVVSPASKGSIFIASADPFEKPLINPAIYSDEFDLLAMVQVMKDSQEFVQSPAWTGFVSATFGALNGVTTDEAMMTYARNFTVTVNHPVGTLGLRVVDASVFPQIPECHPQSLVYTLAERAADLIKAAH
ncbi:GMC oxidoreductase family protein [Pleurotus pulmonarius]